MVFVKDMNDKPWKIFDEERNAAFYQKGATGGSSDPMDVFELHWSNDVVTVVAKPKVFNKSEVEYELRAFTIPEKLKPQKTEIIELIKEALDAYGLGWRRDVISKLQVTVSPQINIQ